MSAHDLPAVAAPDRETRQRVINALTKPDGLTVEQVALLKQTVARGATDDELRLFVAVAGAVNALISPTSITPGGTVASTFSGAPAVLTGTIALPDDPIEYYPVIRYYRR